VGCTVLILTPIGCYPDGFPDALRRVCAWGQSTLGCRERSFHLKGEAWLSPTLQQEVSSTRPMILTPTRDGYPSPLYRSYHRHVSCSTVTSSHYVARIINDYVPYLWGQSRALRIIITTQSEVSFQSATSCCTWLACISELVNFKMASANQAETPAGISIGVSSRLASKFSYVTF